MCEYGRKVSLCFQFPGRITNKATLNVFSKVTIPLAFLPAIEESSVWSASLPTLMWPVLFYFDYSNRGVVVSYCGLI